MKPIRLSNQTVEGNVTNAMEKIELSGVTVKGNVSAQLGKITLSGQCDIRGNVNAQLEKINVLEKSVITGDVVAHGKITLNDATVGGSASSGTGNITVEVGSTVKGNAISNIGQVKVSASQVWGDVRATNVSLEEGALVKGNAHSGNETLKLSGSKVLKNATTASGKIILENKSVVEGFVESTIGRIRVSDSEVKGKLTTGIGDILLDNAVIGGDVASKTGELHVGGNSVIGGDLTLTSNDLALEGLTVKNIRLEPQKDLGRGTFVNGRSACVNITSMNGGSIVGGVIMAQPGCSIDCNGLSVRATQTETRLLTPDSVMYLNGLRQSGEGPETYGEYRRANPEAPKVRGPGWPGELSEPPAAPEPIPGEPEPPKPPSQILTLGAGTHVKGNVSFASGNGKVILLPGARLDGTVDGGILERH